VAERVLVLAPHPDDEIFGCAGAMLGYRQLGAAVHVHVLTDGAGYAPAAQRGQIASVRMAETNAALAILGVANATAADFHDRGLSGATHLGAHLAALLEQHQPNVVLAPSPGEIHPDHRALAWALQALLQPPSGLRPGCLAALQALMFYEVGALQHPNLLLDISPMWPLKLAAMQCFVSQHEQQDYAAQIEGLNRYRSYSLGRAVRYAEAYSLHTAADQYGQAATEPAPQPTASRLRGALSLASVEAEAQQRRIGALQSQLVALQSQCSALQSQLVALQGQLAHAEQHARDLAQTVQLQQAQLQAQALQVQALLASSSWRITRPLRFLVGQMRRFKGTS